jgi:chromosomal replication initiation ATPase DnaA
MLSLNSCGGGREAERDSRQSGNAKLVESIVASAFGVTPDEMCAKTRGRARVALARQVAIYLTHTRLGLSYAESGEHYRRDRTTAAHACRKVEDLRENVRLDTLIDCLERTVDLIPGLGQMRGDQQ